MSCSSYICSSSGFPCSYCAALAEQISSSSIKERGLDITSLSVECPPLEGMPDSNPGPLPLPSGALSSEPPIPNYNAKQLAGKGICIINYVPQTAATTVAFSFIFILLLWIFLIGSLVCVQELLPAQHCAGHHVPAPDHRHL